MMVEAELMVVMAIGNLKKFKCRPSSLVASMYFACDVFLCSGFVGQSCLYFHPSCVADWFYHLLSVIRSHRDNKNKSYE